MRLLLTIIIVLLLSSLAIADQPMLKADGLLLDAKFWFNKSQNEKDPKEEIKQLNTAIKISPRYIEARNNRANAYKSINEFDSALIDYSEILKIDPSNMYAIRNRALLYQQIQKDDSALIDIKNLLELDTTISDHYTMYAQVMSKMGNTNEALKAIEKCLTLDSTNYRAYEVRIVEMFRQKNYKAILIDVEKALIYSPDSCVFLDMKAACLGRLKRYDDAIKNYTLHAKSCIGREKNSYYNIACLYSLKNDPHNALLNLENAFKYGWDDLHHVKIDTDFDNIKNLPDFTKLVKKYEK